MSGQIPKSRLSNLPHMGRNPCDSLSGPRGARTRDPRIKSPLGFDARGAAAPKIRGIPRFWSA